MRLGEGCAGLEPPEEEQPARRPILEIRLVWHQHRLHGDRQPDIVRRPDNLALKSGAGDANDGQRHVIDEYLLTDGTAIAAEPAHPVVMADDHHRRHARRPVLHVAERPA